MYRARLETETKIIWDCYFLGTTIEATEDYFAISNSGMEFNNI